MDEVLNRLKCLNLAVYITWLPARRGDAMGCRGVRWDVSEMP